MKIKTKNFGELEFPEEAIIKFEEGIIGFYDLKRWVIIENPDMQPFKWLQSVDNPKIALMVIDPHLIRSNYKMVIPAEEHWKIGLENLEKREQWLTLCVIVADKEIENSIVNLKAPILINLEERRGRQIILLNDDYDVEEPLFSKEVLEMKREKENT